MVKITPNRHENGLFSLLIVPARRKVAEMDLDIGRSRQTGEKAAR